MKNKYLITGAFVLIIILAIYLIKDQTKENSILSSICNGSLEKLKNENPEEFLYIYYKTKNETSSVISGKCKPGESLDECIERNEETLEKMNCMSRFLKQSDLSEKEMQEIRDKADLIKRFSN